MNIIDMTDPVLEGLRSPIASDTLDALRERLTAAAQEQGVLDIAYTTVESPVGRLLLAATPKGLLRVAYATEDHDRVLQALATKVSPRILQASERLDEVARELDEYFNHHRTGFDVPLDMSLSHGFRRLVQHHLADISYGQTRSYGQVAELVGNPQAVRSVGTACATNPIPIVVPCHRVVRADGSPGGYIGGLEAKAALLDLESAA